MSDHERIWLQPGAETTWCKDRINDDDVEYVRADIAAATIERLEGELEVAKFDLAAKSGIDRATIERLERERDEAIEGAGNFWQVLGRAEKAEAELAKAREARDEYREKWKTSVANVSRVCTRANEMRAELARVRDALEPFSTHADFYEPHEGDGLKAWPTFTVGDFRRARAALAPAKPEESQP